MRSHKKATPPVGLVEKLGMGTGTHEDHGLVGANVPQRADQQEIPADVAFAMLRPLAFDLIAQLLC